MFDPSANWIAQPSFRNVADASLASVAISPPRDTELPQIGRVKASNINVCAAGLEQRTPPFRPDSRHEAL